MLIVDMISLLDFPGAARMAPVDAARRIHALRRRCHAHGWPVVFANDNFARWHSDFHGLVAMAAAAGGAAAQIAQLLAPLPQDYLVLKPKHSAFLSTPLAVLLAKLGVRRLLLAGMALESCILATAMDANAREFEVAVAKDAVAGLPELRASALKVLAGSKAARLVTSRGASAWANGRG
nr:isochorismatase family cysteine hydrolase [Pseudoxanthomonas broegbernensis]